MANPFRARGESEDMASYLKAKQTYEVQNTGSSGVNLGPSGNAITNNLATDVIDRPIKEAESYSSIYDTTREKELANRESELQTINQMYQQQLDNEKRSILAAGEKDLARSNTISAITGMMGAPEATTRAGQSEQRTKTSITKAEDYYTAQKAAAVQAFYDKVDTLTADKAKIEYAASREEAEKAQAEQATGALNALNSMAATGMSWDALMTVDPETVNKLVSASGKNAFEVQLLYNSALPKAQQIDWKTEKLADGQIMFWGQDPITGELKQERVSYDVAPTETLQVVDGVAYGVTKSADGQLTLRPLTEKSETDELLSVTEAANLGVPYGTTKSQAYGINPKSTLTGIEKFTAENNLAKQFESSVGDQRTAIRQVGIMEEALKKANSQFSKGGDINAASQGILVTFQKILDPSSVVRESEYARSGNGQSLLANLEGKYEKLKQGGAGVTLDSLKEFVSTAKTFMNGYEESMLNQAIRIKNSADSQGLDKNNIFTPDVIKMLDSYELKNQYDQLGFDESYEDAVNAYGEEAVKQIIEEQSQSGFNNDLSTSLNGSVNIPESSRLAYVNNNPGNLRYVGQAGATQGQGGFAKFSSPQAGWRAMVNDIKGKQTGNTGTGLGPDSTLRDLVYVYAPPSENASAQYVEQIARQLGISANTKLSKIDTIKLAKAIALKESSTKIS